MKTLLDSGGDPATDLALSMNVFALDLDQVSGFHVDYDGDSDVDLAVDFYLQDGLDSDAL